MTKKLIPSVVLLFLIAPATASAWGPVGHLIVGRAAAPLLCQEAASSIRSLARDQSLGELGLWADRIRRQNRWSHTGPWHYINIPDDGDPRHPPIFSEGDVLQAIANARNVLTQRSASRTVQRNSLRFLIHFVVDLHQPLHVGRADDRGGNQIDVRFGTRQMNLHAFWDSMAIELADLPIDRYADQISPYARSLLQGDTQSDELDWAAQSFALRSRVYDFPNTAAGLTHTLTDEYLVRAQAIARTQLVSATAHLAATLNAIYCR